MLRNEKKILVINLRYIGDTVWTHPFIKNLKMNLPSAEISVLVNRGGEVFLEMMPELSEVICFDRKAMKSRAGLFTFPGFLIELRKKKFDTVFILSNSDRPTIIGFASGAKTRIGFQSDNWYRSLMLTKCLTWDDGKNPHMIEYYLQALTDTGLAIYDRNFTLDIPDRAVDLLCKRFNALRSSDRKAILVHPGARTMYRQWGIDNFATVINAASASYRIFLIGGPDETPIIQELLDRLKKPPDIVSTDLDLMEFAALCRLSNLFVGNDSAPIHIAASTGLFVLGVYGPTLSKHCAPWTDRKLLFDISTVSCRPCRQDTCTHTEMQACLKAITPEMVSDKITHLLENQITSSPAQCN
jgi:lipopolysaccharide heptosyltransferase II